MRFIRFCLCPVMGVLFCVTGVAAAQQPAPVPAAPVPAALATAKKVFVSNAGSDSGLFPHPFSGTESRPYDEFYAGLKTLGAYELENDPADADLVFELHLIAPNGPANADKTKGASDPLPMLRLVIYDRKSHYVLWALAESVGGANFQKTHDRNFDDAIHALIEDVKNLGAGAPSPAA